MTVRRDADAANAARADNAQGQSDATSAANAAPLDLVAALSAHLESRRIALRVHKNSPAFQRSNSRQRALEVYAKQAQNVEAERKATEIRLRAERRAGELLRELPRSPKAGGGDVKSKSARSASAPISAYANAIAQAKIPERTAQRYQELADVPRERFERHLKDPATKPTTSGILRAVMARA